VKLSIETVILLVVTIAIAACVAVWATGYMGTAMAGTADFVASIDQCYTDHMYIRIKNIASVDIVGVEVLVEGTSATVTDLSGVAISSSNPIKAGDMVQLNVTGYTANVGDRLSITVKCTFADGKVVAKDLTAIVKSI